MGGAPARPGPRPRSSSTISRRTSAGTLTMILVASGVTRPTQTRNGSTAPHHYARTTEKPEIMTSQRESSAQDTWGSSTAELRKKNWRRRLIMLFRLWENDFNTFLHILFNKS